MNNEQVKPVEATDTAVTVEPSRLPGDIGHFGDALTFNTTQRDQASGLPVITSVWKPNLVARAQAVADTRKVPLETIIQEWELIWAANG